MTQQCNGAVLLPQPPTTGARRAPPRPLHHQVAASDLALNDRARLAYAAAIGTRCHGLRETGERALFWQLQRRMRREDGPSPLERVAVDLIVLANLGAPEADLRALPEMLAAVIDDLFPAATRRTLEELDVLEARLDAEEDACTMRRHLDRAAGRPEDPAILREEAEVNRAEALVQLERARLLEATARRVERTLPIPLYREPAPRPAPTREAPAAAEAGRAPSARSRGLPAAAHAGNLHGAAAARPAQECR